MAIEVEQKFEFPVGDISGIVDSLRNDSSLGEFAVAYRRKVVNADTYFDVNGQIASRNWSLRVRRKPSGISVALKRPQSGTGSDSSIHREELENPADGSLVEVLGRIIDILQGERIVDASAVEIETLVHGGGVVSALRQIGLNDTYPVKTIRDVWLVSDSGVDVAELVVDLSEYFDDVDGGVREGRIEVEAIDPNNSAPLSDIARFIRRRFNVREVFTSKFQQALIHRASQHLRDKLEAKVTLGDVASYDPLVAQIDAPGEFVRGYNFHRSADRRISDVYFDTKRYDLFRAGWYLRMRREAGAEQFTFRRLKERGEQRYGLVMQQEIVVQSNSDIAKAWSVIQSWLSDVRGVSRTTTPSGFAQLEGSLLAAGLHVSLEVDVGRSSWIVDRAGAGVISSVPDLRSRVAKLKYDRVTFRRPGALAPPLVHFEFEVTGVEDEDAAPNTLRRDTYQAFLGDFLEACADKTNGGRVDKRTSAKYFHGLTELGIIKDKPKFLTDGRLAVQLLARESAPEEVLSRNLGLMRFWSSLATLIAGLFCLSVGAGDGILANNSPDLVSIAIQSFGFVALILGSFYLFKDPPGPVSFARRIGVITCTLIAAVAIAIPWAGRGNVADATAFLGLLPLVFSLARGGMRG